MEKVKCCVLTFLIFWMAHWTSEVLSPSLCMAASEEVVTRQDVMKILDKLDEINRRVDLLEQKDKKKEVQPSSSTRPAPPPTTGDPQSSVHIGEVSVIREDVEGLKEDVAEMGQILEEVEKKTLMDKIALGAEVRTRLDWFDFNDYNGPDNERKEVLPSSRVRLNLFATPLDNLQFNGRLTMFKNWGDDDFVLPRDQDDSRRPTDSSLRVERAYIDWFFEPYEKLPLVLTLGRLPTTDGLPVDLREDTPRKSTYPRLAFDTGADGLALTASLGKLLPLPNPSLKFIYTQFVNDNDEAFFKDESPDIEDPKAYIGQFETNFPGRFEDILFITNLLYINKVGFGEADDPDLETIQATDSLGSLAKLTFFIESKRFLNSWFDWFAGYSYLRTTSEGDPAVVGVKGSDETFTMGLLSDNNEANRNAHGIHAGTRVNLPLESLKDPKIGIEYNYGSKYWVGKNSSSEDPLNKLETRGSVYDFYYIQPFNKYLLARLGYTYVDYDYSRSGSTFGAPESIDQTVSNLYLLLDAKF